MAIEVGFWKIEGDKATQVEYSAMETEAKLEEILGRMGENFYRI